MRTKGLVLDANILIRAVLGHRVRALLEKYEDEVDFYTPDICYEDARKYTKTASNWREIEWPLETWTTGPSLQWQ